MSHESGPLQRIQVDRALGMGGRSLELVQAQLGDETVQVRAEARLRDPSLQGHLSTLEANLVVAALACTLSLVAASAGLALAGRFPPTDAQRRPLASVRRFDGVQSHFQASSTRRRYETRAIMPRFSGVSLTSTLSCIRRRPRPATQARCLFSLLAGLRTSVILICLASAISLNPPSVICLPGAPPSGRQLGDRPAAL